MHTGDAESLRQAEAKGRALAEQIAELLNEAEKLGPVGGSLSFPGARIVRTSTGWTAR
ncbi:hypothetical protein [Streptomyces sp. NPDC002580]|uniref:hypothetical protein n=1 Tax=Streptomyces sp. NPDC002580 TaxID=3364653 RepID=UPI0036AE8AEC